MTKKTTYQLKYKFCHITVCPDNALWSRMLDFTKTRDKSQSGINESVMMDMRLHKKRQNTKWPYMRGISMAPIKEKVTKNRD